MIEVSLSILNNDGYCAGIEHEESGEYIDLIDTYELDERETCLAAARMLREAAARFELLANEAEPCKATTHRRINAAQATEQGGAK